MVALASVTRTSTSRLRVSFSAPMRKDGALRSPQSYAVRATDGGAPVFVGAVTPSTSEDAPTYVDVDITDQTNGKAYEISASGIHSAAGVLISGAAVSFTGEGFAPKVVRIEAVSTNRVDIVFDKPVRANAYALDPASYTWSNGLTTISVLGVAKDRVKLVTSEQLPGVVYALTLVDFTPSFSYASSTTANVGDSVSLAPSITNPFAFPIAYAVHAGTLPLGLALNASTGAITGTPTTPGTLTGIVIRGTYRDGFVDSPAFTLDILLVDNFVVVGGLMGSATSITIDSLTVNRSLGVNSQGTWLAKLRTTDGVAQWLTKWLEGVGGAGMTVGGMVVADDGSVYVCGEQNQVSSTNIKVFDVGSDSVPVFTRTMACNLEVVVTKYNKDGVHQWSRALFSSGGAGNNPTYTGRRALMLLSNGDVLVMVNTENSFSASPIKIQSSDGVTTTDVATYLNGGARLCSCLIRFSPSGAIVGTKRLTVTMGDGSPSNALATNRAYIFSKKNPAQGVMVGHIMTANNGNNAFPFTNTMHFGQGEAGTIAKDVTPDHDPSIREGIVRYGDANLQADMTFDVLQSNDNKDTYALGMDVDESGNIYVLGEGKSFASGTLKADSADWAAPTLTIPSHSDGSYSTPHYGKHDSAGVAQWLKGVGPSSTIPSASEVLLDIVTKSGAPFIHGRADLATITMLKLDEGLGSEQTILGSGSPFTRYFYAKLDPADGHVVALKRVNGQNITSSNDGAGAMWPLRQALVALVGSFSQGSLTFGPGEEDIVLAAPTTSSKIDSFLALISSADLSLALIKRLPTSSVGGDNAQVKANFVAGAKV